MEFTQSLLTLHNQILLLALFHIIKQIIVINILFLFFEPCLAIRKSGFNIFSTETKYETFCLFFLLRRVPLGNFPPECDPSGSFRDWSDLNYLWETEFIDNINDVYGRPLL